MPQPRLSRAELKIMKALWERGPSSVREVHETFPEKGRLAYTTVQTMMYRLETKNAVRRTKKIGGAHVFEATVSRKVAERKVIDDLLELFGGSAQPLMSRLIEAGKLTLDDIEEAQAILRKSKRSNPP
jgi:BlaI family transcriptional regulator, penicillinase repressor